MDVVSDNDTSGRPFPTGGVSPVPLENHRWVLVSQDPDFNTLYLYAAWAKNCTELDPTTGSCELDIGHNSSDAGQVHYYVSCKSGYELYGTGAESKCVTHGDADYIQIIVPD
jgi:hypothetical protein